MERKRALAALLCGILLIVFITSCGQEEKAGSPTVTPVPTQVPTIAPRAEPRVLVPVETTVSVEPPLVTPSAEPPVEVATTPTFRPLERQSLAALRQKLAAEIAPYGESVAIAVTSLQTGETIAVNGDTVFYPASAIKAIALLSVLKDVEDGLYPLADVEEKIVAMMTYSDNTAADVLIDKTGFDRIDAIIERVGLTSTLFCHGFDFLAYACHTPNRMSAIDANRLWQALYDGKILADNYRTLALGYSALPEVRFIFAPEGFLVAHKSGYVDEYIADSGLVIGNGSGYAVSLFSAGADGAEGLAQELTEIVFAWFFGATQAIDGG